MYLKTNEGIMRQQKLQSEEGHKVTEGDKRKYRNNRTWCEQSSTKEWLMQNGF